MNCPAKHTKIQIPNEDWECPKCGARAENMDEKGFYLDEIIDEKADEGCSLMHVHQYCYCENCGYSVSCPTLVRDYIKKKSLVPCPFCEGKGVVQKTNVAPGLDTLKKCDVGPPVPRNGYSEEEVKP